VTDRQLAVTDRQLAVTDRQLYGEFQHAVINALLDAGCSSIIPAQQSKQLEDDISRADTVVVLCFDQEWAWANKIILQLRQMMSEQSAKTRIFIAGPPYKNKERFVPAFKFRTIVGVTSDNRVPLNHVADEIKKIAGGTGSALS
jgi:uncharacterized protein YceK